MNVSWIITPRCSFTAVLRVAGRLVIVLALLGGSIITVARPAQAFTAFNAPLTGGANFITGFRPCPSIGPIGVLHDGSNFFASDFCAGTTYKFPPSGGTLPGILSANNGLTHGLIKANGNYYGISRGAAGVELSTATRPPPSRS